MTATMLRAELAALDAAGVPFDWIIEDAADAERIIRDTHAEALPLIEGLRQEHAGELDPERVSFHLGGGEPWARVDIRSEARRAAEP